MTDPGRRIPNLIGTALFLLAAAATAGATPLRDAAGPYRLDVLVDGRPAPTFAHDGETYLLGHKGERYVLRVTNQTGSRIEAVVSVDGLDVLDGEPAEIRSKRGYIVPAYGTVEIDGWRISTREAAAFRFSSVSRSYAGRTGRARDVGVIGVAVFVERPRPVPHRPVFVPWRDDVAGRRKGSADAQGKDDLGELTSETQGVAPGPVPPQESDDRGSSAKAEHAPRAEGAEDRSNRRQRPGLGTEYGEAVSSPVYEVEFRRQHPSRPDAVLGARYNDRKGLIAMGVDVDGRGSRSDADLRRSADPFPAERGFAAPPPGWRR